jgi:DNA repair protein RAD9
LVHQLDNNGHLLTGYHILFIDNKSNNKNWDTCEFIFHAFGAKSLRYVKSKSDLENHLDSTQSRYLVYDNSGTFRVEHALVYGVVDWEWVVQCVISGFTWEPRSFK